MKILILGVFIIAILGSCKKDTIQPTVIPVNTTVKFSTDVYPLIATHNCTMCHGSGSSTGLDLSGNYSAVRTNLLVNAVVAGNSATSLFYTNFSGAGHKGISLTTVELSNVKSWIDLGALDN
ncbi:MAG: hypothetical protein HXX18_00250 [Bacteroidetes bacterium]|nr:hypothetical protein [Bacteroidota bacterium]